MKLNDLDTEKRRILILITRYFGLSPISGATAKTLEDVQAMTHINDDLTIDVAGTVWTSKDSDPYLDQVKFGRISGHFYAQSGEFTEVPKCIPREAFNYQFGFSELTMESFYRMPHPIHARNIVDISNNEIVHFENIYKWIRTKEIVISIDEQRFKDDFTVSTLLPILLIPDLEKFYISDPDVRGKQIQEILNKHIQSKNVAACQIELINAGFPQMARMRYSNKSRS